MFYEDINTLYEKYKYCGAWYELSYDDIVDNNGNMVDFFKIQKNNDDYDINIFNTFLTNILYVAESTKPTTHSGEPNIHLNIDNYIPFWLPSTQSVFLYMTCDYLYQNSVRIAHHWIPKSSLNVIKCGAESNTVKVYFKKLQGITPIAINVGSGKYVNGNEWDVDSHPAPILTDDDGTYVELTVQRDDDEFTIIDISWQGEGHSYFRGKILNYKALPTITFNTLYRGSTQTVEVYFDGELIDSKYYDLLYQNQVLSDGKITIGEDVTELELEVYLKHPEYISTKLKYNLPVGYYDCRSQADIEAGLEMGLSTIRLTRSIVLSNVVLENVKLVRQSISYILSIYDSKFNNILFENIRVEFRDSKSSFTNCTFDNCEVGGEMRGIEYKVHFVNSTITNSFVHYSLFICSENCVFDNNYITDALIFSDDMITITDNRFVVGYGHMSIPSYYPYYLYLTGEFDCKNNMFLQHDSYRDFKFEVALIKTIPETDIDEFIRLNNFNIDITVDDTNYTGLFYSLIDDSKLHYKELR